MKINMDRILKNADNHVRNNKSIMQKASKKMDDYMLGLSDSNKSNRPPTVEDAGYKFANVLLHEIYAQHFAPNLEADLERISVGTPFKTGDGKYKIIVRFDDDLERETMSTLKDYPDVNLAYLYDRGVDHVMKQIFETTPDGRRRASQTVIPFTGFMESAIIDFIGNYGAEYNVINIDIKDGLSW